MNVTKAPLANPTEIGYIEGMDLKNRSGVYEVRNIVNGLYYIGSTNNAHKRKTEHFSLLRNGRHHNLRLQMDFNEYGEAAFEFNLIQEVLTDNLKEVEQTYLDEEKPYYNLSKDARVGGYDKDHPRRDEIVKKISESLKKMYATMTPEERQQRYGRPGESSPHWKGGLPHCQKCGKQIDYNHKHCRECRPYFSGEDNPFFGKTHSEEAKKKMVEPHYVPVIIHGREYPSATEAAKCLGIPRSTLYNRLDSKSKKFEGYKRKQS